jgi:hypothetical protein
MLRNLHKKQKGFTIMEALIATFLFSVTMSSIIGIYLSTVKLHRRANAIRTVTENVRYISESLSKEIKNGTIDWAEPKPFTADTACGRTPVANPDWRLPIVNVDGDRICYYLGDTFGFRSSTGEYLWMIKNELPPVQLTTASVKVKQFRVYVYPLANPYCNNPPSCSSIGTTKQPHVIITARIESNIDPNNIVSLPFETTINIPRYDFTRPQ